MLGKLNYVNRVKTNSIGGSLTNIFKLVKYFYFENMFYLPKMHAEVTSKKQSTANVFIVLRDVFKLLPDNQLMKCE